MRVAEIIYNCLKDQVVPGCDGMMGNRFYNTIYEINNGASGVSLRDLIEALIDNKELALPDDLDVNDLDDDVIAELNNLLSRDLGV